MLPILHTAETGVSSVAPGPGYPQIRLTTAAHCLTPQRVISLDAICVTVSILVSFFCHSNVIETQSAYSNQGLLWFICFPFLKNLIFLRRKTSVLRFSICGTLRYSQDLIAKKNAPIESCDVAFWVSDEFILANSLRTQAGRAFCCTVFGSPFLNAL